MIGRDIPERRVVAFNEEAAWTPQEKKANLWLCGLILTVVGLPSLAVATVSTVFNAMFAASLGSSYEEKAAWVVASLGFSLFVIGIPVARPVIRLRRPDLDNKAFWLWLACLGFSVTSALGFSAATRDHSASTKRETIDQRQRIKTEIARIEGELDRLGGSRPVLSIKAEMDRRLAADAYIARYTASCTQIDNRRARDGCAPILALRQELAGAEAAVKLDEKLIALTKELKTAPEGGTISDPQADVLDWMSGRRVGQDTMRRALSLFVALLVEAGAAIGLSVAAEAFVTVLRDPGGTGEIGAPVALPSGLRIDLEPDNEISVLGGPEATFALWTERCVSIVSGNRVSAKVACDAYQNWCAQNGLPELPYIAFCRKMTGFVAQHGGRTLKSNTTQYEGIAISEIKSPPLLGYHGD